MARWPRRAVDLHQAWLARIVSREYEGESPMMKLLIVAASLAAAVPVSAQDAAHPVIAGYGVITPLPGAAHAPAAATPPRAVFNIAKAAATPAALTPRPDKVARSPHLLGSRSE